MNLPILLETAISLFALLTIMSILASSVLELSESVIRRRSKFLKEAIDKALSDPSLSCNYAELFYKHPQIKTLQENDKKFPSYINPEVFSQVLIDILINQYEKEHSVLNQDTQRYNLSETVSGQSKEERLTEALKAIQYSELGVLLNSFRNTSDKIEDLQKKITEWYNAYMERLGGWFKRSTHKLLFLSGLVIAAGINFDLVKITQEIYNNTEVRENILVYAESVNLPNEDKLDDEVLKSKIEQNFKDLDSFGLTLGWSHIDCKDITGLDFLRMLCGWLLAGVAVTRGSSFWFGAMNKLISLRSAGTRSEPKKKRKKDS